MDYYEHMLRTVYGSAYDLVRNHPGFDGRPHPDVPALLPRGLDPDDIQPWPGAADVHRMGRDEWVQARLDAVARGEEEPPLRRPRSA